MNNEPKIGSINIYNGTIVHPKYSPKYRILIDYFEKYHNTIFDTSGIECTAYGKIDYYIAFDYAAIRIKAENGN